MNKFIGHSALLVFSKLSSISGSLLFVYLLSPDDYGQYVIYLTLINYLGIICGLNLNQSFGRYLYEGVKQINPKDFGSQIFLITLLSFLFLGSISISLIQKYFFEDFDSLTGIILLIISFCSILESMLIQFCIRLDNLKVGIIYFLIRNTVPVVVFLFSIIGTLNVTYIFITESIFASFGIVYIFKYLDFHLVFSNFFYTLKYSFSYSLPLLPYTFVLIVLSQFDRLLINDFFGNEVTGAYSYNYNFGIILSFFFGAMMNLKNNEFYELCEESRGELFKEHQRRLLFNFLFFSLVFLLILLSLSKFIYPFQILSEVRYLPIVVSAILFFSLWQIWVRILGYFRLTKIIGSISIFTGVLYIVSLYFLFKSNMGYWYAYWATLFAYIFMVLFGLYFVNRLSDKFVKPFFRDFIWYIVFLIISIISLNHLVTSITLYILLLGLLLLFKRRYLINY